MTLSVSVFMTELHVEVTVILEICVYLYHMNNLNLTEEPLLWEILYLSKSITNAVQCALF